MPLSYFWFQLQVPDEALSLVMSMGFREHEVKRALRMSNQDVGSAVDFLVEQKARKAEKREEDLRQQKEIKLVSLTNPLFSFMEYFSIPKF